MITKCMSFFFLWSYYVHREGLWEYMDPFLSSSRDFNTENMICVLQDDSKSQHNYGQTRSTSCSDSCVSTLSLVWNYGVTAHSTR